MYYDLDRIWSPHPQLHGDEHARGGADPLRGGAILFTRKAAGQTITTATDTKVLIDTKDFGPGGLQLTWNSTSNRIDVNETGVYVVSGGLAWDVNGTGLRNVMIFLNGAQLLQAVNNPNTATRTYVSLSFPYRFSAGDYLELYARQNSGVDLSTDAVDKNPYLAVAWMSS